ncbi:hypothetical protein GPECTOR_2g1074 [Gonium pectorale]|uniref:HotDog ACOT-type domain-containing protein n=1 Tax=Gonium pectorale TaxID=33097 RepID=A0A150H0C5_GONPE|nr:hypothetical protein GPECTOR_2g1074 [Gonium pectorale]|eukprot:KXZ55525.1 hypothetical protein GPECTOR_2g1074 [Gonium pectorale]
MEVRYPFASRPDLWRAYLSPQPSSSVPGDPSPGGPALLAPEPFLEDFDTFAADVAARHVGAVPDSMLVTAIMERFTWHLRARPEDEDEGEDGGEDEREGGGGVPQERGGGGSAGGLVELAPVDMRLAGQVTWVGRSSMEVLLQLTTDGPSAANAPSNPAPTPTDADARRGGAGSVRVLPPGRLLAAAEFVMALRDSSLRRAVDVPPLHPRGPLERELFRRGREHHRLRQLRREQDKGHGATAAAAGHGHGHGGGHAAAGAAHVAPAAEGSGAAEHGPAVAEGSVGRLGRDTPGAKPARPPAHCDAQAGGEHHHLGAAAATAAAQEPSAAALAVLSGTRHGDASASAVPVGATELRRSVVARWEDRNTSGTVFGGHLLRLAYEHAAATAEAFAGSPCELLALEEGAISAPARPGDTLHCVGRVVWSEPGGRALRVAVRLTRSGPDAQQALALTIKATLLAPPTVAAEAAVGAGRREGGGGTGGLRAVEPGEGLEAAEAAAAARRHAAVLAALAHTEAEGGEHAVPCPADAH